MSKDRYIVDLNNLNSEWSYDKTPFAHHHSVSITKDKNKLIIEAK